ncbi:MAG: hypothetical protein ABIG28_02295 [archaeon]
MINRKTLLLIGLAIIFAILAILTTYFYSPLCGDLKCFQDAMKKCKSARYINEQDEASWRYEILKFEDGQCKIEVTLLQPKAGELSIEKLVGQNMVCDYPKGITSYPEGDLERCHGRLKEELQAMVIKKLHAYIIENIGEVNAGLDFYIEQNP